jgi:hypothetical protein
LPHARARRPSDRGRRPRLRNAMPTLEIDGQTITVPDGLNLIEAADRLDI